MTRRMGVDVLVSPVENAKTIEQLKAEGADPEVISWRERMETDEAKKLYRARAGLAELRARFTSHQTRVRSGDIAQIASPF